MKLFETSIIMTFTMLLCSMVSAKDIYQWQDSGGNIYFSDVPPSLSEHSQVVYRDSNEGKIYQWKNQKGEFQYSDDIPADIAEINVSEIQIEHAEPSITQVNEQYSIQNQLKRMEAHRQQQDEERHQQDQARIESFLIAQELKILKMEDKIRTEGYGPRPYYNPYRSSTYSGRYQF